MYSVRPYAGMGAVNWLGNTCVADVDFGCPAPDAWVKWFGMQGSTIAPVGSPTGSALTVPPASGVDAQATVDALVNQQLVDQNALNAESVRSSTLDQAASSVMSAAGAFPWMMAGLIGIGVFALVAVGGGSPRRYGR